MSTVYHNYNIKSSKGVFYQTSKDKQEGFNFEAKTKDGEIRWHKEQDEIRGVLSRLEKVEFSGREFVKISFTEASGAYGSLLLPIFDSRKGIDSWIKAFVPSMCNLKKGMEVIFALNRKNMQAGKDGKEYLWKNVYMKDAVTDTRIDWAFIPKDTVPKAVQVPDEATGK